ADRGARAGDHSTDRQDHRAAQAAGIHHSAGRAEFPLRFHCGGSVLRHGARPHYRPVRQCRARGQSRQDSRVSRRVKSGMNKKEGVSQMKRITGVAALAALLMGATAQAQTNIKIGVLSDMSSLYSDIGGPGSVAAAKLAIADFTASNKDV